MDTKTTTLENRLLKYSLVTCGLLALNSNQANAGVVITDAHNTIVDAGHSFFSIDFDGGNFGDVYYPDVNIVYNPAFSIYPRRICVGNSSMGSVLGNDGGGGRFLPFALNSSQNVPVIPGAGQWGKASLNALNTNGTIGNWRGVTNKYLGVKFELQGSIHYGWVKMSINAEGTQAIIHSYAYETTAGVGISAPLPVELTVFTAAANGKAVELKWNTATEENNYGFEVERQVGSKQNTVGNWEKIGFVEGHGNSNSPKDYSFLDENPPAGDLEYRLKQIDKDGNFKYYSQTAKINFSITDVKEKKLPTEYSLSQNYPNPFNPTTLIKYSIPEAAGNELVTLKVYNMLGEEAAVLVNEIQPAGNYEVEFSAGSSGNAFKLSSGIYLYKLTAGNFVETKKMNLLK